MSAGFHSSQIVVRFMILLVQLVELGLKKTIKHVSFFPTMETYISTFADLITDRQFKDSIKCKSMNVIFDQTILAQTRFKSTFALLTDFKCYTPFALLH